MTTVLNQERIDMLVATRAYELPQVHHTIEPGRVLNEMGVELYTGGGEIGWALQNLSLDPQEFVVIENGEYAPMGRVSGLGGGIYQAREKGGVQIGVVSGDDALYTDDGGKVRETTFRGINWRSGERSVWTTYSPRGPYPVSWRDCVFDGMYDHRAGSGPEGKWLLNPFAWVGYLDGCTLQNSKREHALYYHGPGSDLLLRNCVFQRNGRTGVQGANREDDEGWNSHELHVVGSTFEDNNLWDGGSALTVSGQRSLLVEDTEFFIGRNRSFRDDFMIRTGRKIFGTGHIAVWNDLGRALPCEDVTLRDLILWVHAGDGDRKGVEVTNSKKLTVAGRMYAQMGWHPDAFELSLGMPVDTDGLGDYSLSEGAGVRFV